MAASESAVVDVAMEVVLADYLLVQALLDFLPWEEESFAQEPFVQAAHFLVVVVSAAAAVALPMVVAVAEKEALPIAVAADIVVAVSAAAVQRTAVGVAD